MYIVFFKFFSPQKLDLLHLRQLYFLPVNSHLVSNTSLLTWLLTPPTLLRPESSSARGSVCPPSSSAAAGHVALHARPSRRLLTSESRLELNR